MPRTLSFPAPSATTCPICHLRLSQPRCDTCGVDFRSPEGGRLWALDHQLHDLCGERNAVVRTLLEPAAVPAPPASFASLGVSDAMVHPPGPKVPRLAEPVLSAAASGAPLALPPLVQPGEAAPDPTWAPGAAPGGPTPVDPSAGSTGPPPMGAEPAPRPGWSAPEVLVALGALSLVAAVAVFTAVSWDRLAATAQGALLVVLTGVVVGGAVACRRRGLLATAESLGAVGVALGLADVHVARVALDGAASGRVVTGVGVGVLAGAAVLVGRSMRLRSLTAAGAGLAFLPGPILVASSPSVLLLAAVATAQALLAVTVDRHLGRCTLARAVTRVGAVLSWAIAGLLALGAGVDGLITTAAGLGADGSQGPAGSMALLVALAAVAVVAVLVAGWTRPTQSLVLTAAVGAVVAAAGLGATTAVSSIEAWLAVMAASGGLVALVGLGVAHRDPARPWAAVTGNGVAVAAAASAYAGVQVVATALALLGSTGSGADGDAGTPLVDRFGTDVERSLLADGLTLAHLGALLAVGLVGWAGRRRWAVPVLAVATGAVAVGAPVALDLTVGVAVTGLLPLVVAGAALAVRRGDRDPWLRALLVGLAALVVVVSVASTALVLAVTAVVVAAGMAVAAAALVRHEAVAAGWTGGALAALLATVVLDVVVLGHGRGAVAVSLAIAAALVAGVGPVVERLRPRATEAVGVADLLACLGLLTALVAAPSLDGASVVVALAGAAAGLSALRPSRRLAWIGAVGASVLLVWLRLGAGGIVVPEAYTLPFAAGLLVVGAYVRWDETVDGSWLRLGPGLAVALGPSTLLALSLDDLGRTVAVVVAGVAVTVWGAAGRAQAPLALGGAAVGAIALRHLAPVAADLPRYLVFAAAGVVLVAVGATFEQRRRDLRQARDAFARLQ